MIKEHDTVVLTEDLPNEGLRAGDVGTVVHVHKQGEGYEVEFMTLAGQTIARVFTVGRSSPSRESSRHRPRQRITACLSHDGVLTSG